MSGKAITIAGFATLIAAVAANGEKTLAVLAAIPAVISKFSEGMTFGAWSTILSLVVAVLAFLHADARFKTGPESGSKGRDFRADTLAIFVGFTCVIAQTLVTSVEKPAAVWLQSTMIGLALGMLAPYVGRGLIVASRNLRSLLNTSPTRPHP